MTKEEMLLKFVKVNVEKFEKANSGLDALRLLGEAIENHVKVFDEISEVFERRKIHNVWINCPECSSPVLLNYKNCNVCQAPLLDAVEIEEEEVKVTKKENKKSKKVAKPKKEVAEVEETEEEEESGDSAGNYPSERSVNKMAYRELKKLLKEEDKLNVDPTKYKGKDLLDDFREAVNAAIDKAVKEDDAPDEAKDESDDDGDDYTYSEIQDMSLEELNEVIEEEELNVKSSKKVKKLRDRVCKALDLEEKEDDDDEDDFDFEFGDEDDD